MKFKSKAERMAHPEAKLIPENLWNDHCLFGNELPDWLLPLMDAKNSEQLPSILTNMIPMLFSFQLKAITWLSIALSHPGLEFQGLVKIAYVLQLDGVEIFKLLAVLGNLSHLRKMMEAKVIDSIQAMREEEDDDYACWWAFQIGHPNVLEPDAKSLYSIQAKIAEEGFFAYRNAAENGHLEFLKLLEEKEPDSIQAMIKAHHFYAYRNAAENAHLEICHHILSQSSACMAYAEMHVEEYGERIVNPFIQAKLLALHQEALNTPANAVFDITYAEQAKICFFIIRNLIRRNDRALDDEIRFLLNIPSVKALAHVSVNEGEESELVRLATRIGNSEASSILLNIPDVHLVAEQNGFYAGEANGQLDLAALARDSESSMTALSVGELRRLQSLITAYEPMLKAAGVPHLIDELRLQLTARYENKPATIEINGQLIKLPMAFSDFNVLNLHGTQKKMALKAYYQNKDHTAFRYLLKPNPWINPIASYVRENEDGRFATFEEYQPLIAMFWLGAIDEAIAPTDGHTLETRLEHFIDELAHINRALNWDNTRINHETGKKEEFDDLTGDRPSCFSGVKRRLFQSLLGHPLMTMLTPDILLEEVRDFANEYFKKIITPENITQLITAYDDYIMHELPECVLPLACLNIPQEEQQAFELRLEKKIWRVLYTRPIPSSGRYQ